MASISNRQFTYGMVAFIVLLVVALFLGFVVAPLLGRASIGWLAVALGLVSLLIIIFTVLRLQQADEREQATLKTLLPGQKQS